MTNLLRVLLVGCFNVFSFLSRLIHLDTMCSKEDIEKSENTTQIEVKSMDESVFSMEVDDVLDVDVEMKNETARKLDFCIHRICKYIHTECYDKSGSLKGEKMKSLYQDLLFVFETVIIPTCGAVHLPFVFFYLISFDRNRTEGFLNYLWKKITNVNIAGPIRQSAVYYLTGILSHASFVSTRYYSFSFAVFRLYLNFELMHVCFFVHYSTIKSSMQEMASWLLNYIDTTDCTRGDDTNAFIRTHAVFYATCQSLFYLINTRHRDLGSSNKSKLFNIHLFIHVRISFSNLMSYSVDLKCLEKLNLGKIVSSSLNPLLVCNPSIVNYFARVTHKYELTYCFTLLNGYEAITSSCSDGWLDGCFPFEYFLLKRQVFY